MNIARLKNSRAFTLIELIVVIVVLGILAALVAFAYQSFINDSRAEAAEKTGDQVSTTLMSKAVGAQDDVAGYFDVVADVVAAAEDDITVVDAASSPASGWSVALGTVTVDGDTGAGMTLRNVDTKCEVDILFGDEVGGKNAVGDGVCD